jgi:FkbM family methyltransferase
MKQIINKIKLRSQQFSNHPITKDNRYKAMIRYIVFNSLNRIKPDINYNWVENLVFYASKGDGGIVGNIYYGLYEFNESAFVLHFLKEDDTFLDIGANVGHYSLLASGIKNCKSISIEPVPKTFVRLNQQVALNKLEGNISTLNIGVGNKCTTLYFSIDKNTMNKIVTKKYKNSVEIPVKTVDAICEGMEISLMKIDVEGYEKFVLDGSETTLKNENLKAVIIEINFSNKFYGVENDEVSGILFKNDFKPYKYNPLNRNLEELKTKYNEEQFNTIFIRDLDFVKNRLSESRRIKIWDKLI